MLHQLWKICFIYAPFAVYFLRLVKHKDGAKIQGRELPIQLEIRD